MWTDDQFKKAAAERDMGFYNEVARKIIEETQPDPWWVMSEGKDWSEGEMNLLYMDAEELDLVSQQSEEQKKKSCLDRALEIAHDIGETIVDLFIGD